MKPIKSTLVSFLPPSGFAFVVLLSAGCGVGSPEAEPVAVATIVDSTPACRWFVGGRQVYGRSAVVRAGEEICVANGVIRVASDEGVILNLSAPAIWVSTTASRGRLLEGTARLISAGNSGDFEVGTRSANIKFANADCGVSVDDSRLRLAVFGGEVDLAPLAPHASTTVEMGEGVELDATGRVAPLKSIFAGSFPEANLKPSPTPPPEPTILSVSASQPGRACLEIVTGGFGEDVRAYADRGYHEWNGLTSAGLPTRMIGGDYVRLFNNQKRSRDLRLYVTLARSAALFVLLDDRAVVPQWLSAGFRDTGDDVGLDEGPYVYETNRFADTPPPAIGPGQGIDRVFSVWERVVQRQETVVCGPLEGTLVGDEAVAMYGIVASPLPNEPTKDP